MPSNQSPRENPLTFAEGGRPHIFPRWKYRIAGGKVRRDYLYPRSYKEKELEAMGYPTTEEIREWFRLQEIGQAPKF